MRKIILILPVLFLLGSVAHAKAPLGPDDFWLANVSFSNCQEDKVRLLAELVNGTTSFIKKAIFSVVIYNYDEKIIDKAQFTVTNINPRETRPIELFFDCPSKDRIFDIKIKFVQVLE